MQSDRGPAVVLRETGGQLVGGWANHTSADRGPGRRPTVGRPEYAPDHARRPLLLLPVACRAERGAARDRHRADGRRDRRHQQWRAGPVAGCPRGDRDPDRRSPRRPGGGRGGITDGAVARRSRGHHRRPRPHARRPDPGGRRRGVRRAGHRGRRHARLAAGAMAPAPPAVSGGQRQAGVDDPLGHRPAQSQRHRPGLVGRPARRPGDRAAARPAARDATRCGPTRSCPGWPRAAWDRTARCARYG